MEAYEAPAITEIGSVAEVTAGSWGRGNQDRVNRIADIFLS